MEKMVENENYEDEEEKQRLTLALKKSRWESLGKHPRGSLSYKMAVLGKKVAEQNILLTFV